MQAKKQIRTTSTATATATPKPQSKHPSPSTCRENLTSYFDNFVQSVDNEKQHLLKEISGLEEHHCKLLKEIDTMETLKQKWDKVVNLNVGGKKFAVSHTTLTKSHPDSMLAVMFSGRHTITLDEQGFVFIDRDPDLFRHILSFLRFGDNWVMPEDDSRLMKLLRLEFDFFQIPFPETPEQTALRELFEKGGFFDSKLLNVTFANVLRNWQDPKKKWKLIYRATTHGFEPQKFHQLCDNKGPTFTILRSVSGYLLGGYTSASWTSNGQYITDPTSFLFTLTNPYNIEPTKLAERYQGRGHNIYGTLSSGPTFGSGHDLNVQHTNCSINLSTFVDTTGRSYNLFTGESSFQLSDIEVFCVYK